jgi:DMSO reductase family type II enzyme heme b subunit
MEAENVGRRRRDERGGALRLDCGLRGRPLGRADCELPSPRRGGVLLHTSVFVLLLFAIRNPQSAIGQEPRGKAIYEKWCAECHGNTGAGDGSAQAYMLPRPRDFTKGIYQIRTTASGELPTDADLRRVINDGMPGTAMPQWRDRLTDTQREDVIAYIKSFSQFFTGAAPRPIDIGNAPRSSAEAIAEGREVYTKLECFKCHGQTGLGDGTSAPTLTDDWDQPIFAADLSASWRFNGGSSVADVYARLRTGLDGTPMPSFSDVVDSKIITDEQLWRVAQYVRSLSPDEPPAVREVIRARLAEGALPHGPDDTTWARAEAYYVPLVGQIIVKPRWFAPAVEGVWVKAMHDGMSLAMRVTWHDRSRSPDPSWDEWLARIRLAMTDVDGPLASTQGADLLVVQFPTTAQATEPPYFLGGSTRRPAHQWRWSSTPDAVAQGTATGLGKFTAQAGAAELTHAARYAEGEWQLQMTRALVPADTTRAPALVAGRAIPIAFFAADGSNGEDAVRGAVSGWYSIYLDVPTPTRVYVAPGLTMLLTAGLGFMLVRQAQRRERNAERSNPED